MDNQRDLIKKGLKRKKNIGERQSANKKSAKETGAIEKKGINDASKMALKDAAISTLEAPKPNYETGASNTESSSTTYANLEVDLNEEYELPIEPYPDTSHQFAAANKEQKQETIKTISQAALLQLSQTEKATTLETKTKKELKQDANYVFSDNQYKKHNIQWLAYKSQLED